MVMAWEILLAIFSVFSKFQALGTHQRMKMLLKRQKVPLIPIISLTVSIPELLSGKYTWRMGPSKNTEIVKETLLITFLIIFPSSLRWFVFLWLSKAVVSAGNEANQFVTENLSSGFLSWKEFWDVTNNLGCIAKYNNRCLQSLIVRGSQSTCRGKHSTTISLEG